MRYDKHHKDQTRQRIVETASRRFRANGLDAEGVKSLMTSAGLTNGAFYHHFESKEDLAREAVAEALKERVALLQRAIDGGGGLETLVRHYFSAAHRDNPGRGCPSSALASEVARHSDAVRGAYTAGVNAFLALAATQWPALPPAEARARAIALYGLMAGAMQVARATNDRVFSDEILEAGLHAALKLAARV